MAQRVERSLILEEPDPLAAASWLEKTAVHRAQRPMKVHTSYLNPVVFNSRESHRGQVQPCSRAAAWRVADKPAFCCTPLFLQTVASFWVRSTDGAVGQTTG